MYNNSSSSSSSSILSSTSYGCPCAACKFLRRKCVAGCVFAPHFPPEEYGKFVNVHKIFGAGNVTKLLSSLPPHLRDDAVNSLCYEAEARVRDPVYGCVADISFLQTQVDALQKQLDAANASLSRYAMTMPPNIIMQQQQQQQNADYYPCCPAPFPNNNSEDLLAHRSGSEAFK